jgi:hypothetical protein
VLLCWTLKHLLVLHSGAEKTAVTHIISRPRILLQDDFKLFLAINDKSHKVPMIAYIYIGNFLTKKKAPWLARAQALLPVPCLPAQEGEFAVLHVRLERTSSTPNHFLGLMRSGSTRLARSLNLHSELLSCISQDSLTSEAADPEVAQGDGVAMLLAQGEENKDRALYCYNLQVERRSRVVGLGVGSEGSECRPRTRDGHGLTQTVTPAPITASMCQNM